MAPNLHNDVSPLVHKGIRDVTIPESFEQVQGWFFHALEEMRDRRADGWWSMDTPYLNWAMCAAYLFLVFVGIRVMSNPARRNFKNELKPLVVVYNLLLVGLSLYMFVEIYREATQLNMGWVCNRVDYAPKSTNLLRLMWLYYISKAIEFNDTFLYILCGKLNQVTVLHVWHHSFMWLVWWVGVRFAGGGDSWFSSWVNCGVHVIMYAYYALSAAGVRVPGFMKKMITQLQLLQFFIVMAHCVIALRMDCPYPHWMYESLIAFLVSLVVLFGNFYVQTYLRRGRRSAARAGGKKIQ